MSAQPAVTLVLANDVADVEKIIKQERLNPDDSACITEPSYLDFVRLYPNEKVYISANASSKLTAAIKDAATRDLGPGQNINLCVITSI